MSTSVLETITALPRDLRSAASTLGEKEARYLVDTYYQVQDFRTATRNQVRQSQEEPHATLLHFGNQFEKLEKQIKSALDQYSAAHPLGQWARKNYGVGPVITAGLLAHIDIRKAPTVGHIWRYAGLDPTSKWNKGEKRPWNAELKVLCWKLGDSFVKFSGRDDAFYGKVYLQRKQYEVERDEAGGNAEVAKEELKTRNFKDKATKAIYESGHLPPGRLDLRARRYAVKLFLAHFHEAAYRLHYGKLPPLPYALAILEHGHEILSPVEMPPIKTEHMAKRETVRETRHDE